MGGREPVEHGRAAAELVQRRIERLLSGERDHRFESSLDLKPRILADRHAAERRGNNTGRKGVQIGDEPRLQRDSYGCARSPGGNGQCDGAAAYSLLQVYRRPTMLHGPHERFPLVQCFGAKLGTWRKGRADRYHLRHFRKTAMGLHKQDRVVAGRAEEYQPLDPVLEFPTIRHQSLFERSFQPVRIAEGADGKAWAKPSRKALEMFRLNSFNGHDDDARTRAD